MSTTARITEAPPQPRNTHTNVGFRTRAAATAGARTGFLAPVGRALFSAIFIQAFFGHLDPATAAYAASAGVPLAKVAVPLSGVIALLGGTSILLGYRARMGALLIVAFLLPVTLMMHNFWAMPEPAMAQLHAAMFFKNIAMIGSALFIAHMGAGPVSFDSRRRTASSGH